MRYNRNGNSERTIPTPRALIQPSWTWLDLEGRGGRTYQRSDTPRTQHHSIQGLGRTKFLDTVLFVPTSRSSHTQYSDVYPDSRCKVWERTLTKSSIMLQYLRPSTFVQAQYYVLSNHGRPREKGQQEIRTENRDKPPYSVRNGPRIAFSSCQAQDKNQRRRYTGTVRS